MSIKYNYAIIRMPSQHIDKIKEQNPYLNKPDYVLTLREFKHYINALEYANVEVLKLKKSNTFEYACAVNDHVVVIPNKAVIVLNLNDKKRNSEYNEIKRELENHFDEQQFFKIEKGHIRGSDVIQADNVFFVGKSNYTNSRGIREFTKIAEKFKMKVVKIDLFDFTSINACVAYLQNNLLLISEKISNKVQFSGFKRIVVPEEEEYALSSIWVNGIVIMPAGCYRTAIALRKLGLRVIELNLSEFKKVGMNPNLLSIRF